jgi:hypothetical protein
MAVNRKNCEINKYEQDGKRLRAANDRNVEAELPVRIKEARIKIPECSCARSTSDGGSRT